MDELGELLESARAALIRLGYSHHGIDDEGLGGGARMDVYVLARTTRAAVAAFATVRAPEPCGSGSRHSARSRSVGDAVVEIHTTRRRRGTGYTLAIVS